MKNTRKPRIRKAAATGVVPGARARARGSEARRGDARRCAARPRSVPDELPMPGGCTHKPGACEGCNGLLTLLTAVLQSANTAVEAIDDELCDAEAGDQRLPALRDAQRTIDVTLARMLATLKSGKNGVAVGVQDDLSLLSAVAMAWDVAFAQGLAQGMQAAEVQEKHDQADRAMQAAEDDADDADQGPGAT